MNEATDILTAEGVATNGVAVRGSAWLGDNEPQPRVGRREGPVRSGAGGGWLLHGWARAYSEIAFGNYMESRQVADSNGRLSLGPNYRKYWRDLQNKARRRLGLAAARAGVRLKFGSFNSVEILGGGGE